MLIVTYKSGARKASVAVWGSFNDRPSCPNGLWVSPTKLAVSTNVPHTVYIRPTKTV